MSLPNNQSEENAWTTVGATSVVTPNGRGSISTRPVRAKGVPSTPTATNTTDHRARSSRNTQLTIQILQKPSSTFTSSSSSSLARTSRGGGGGGNDVNKQNAVVSGTYSGRKQASSSLTVARRPQPLLQRTRDTVNHKNGTASTSTKHSSIQNHHRVQAEPQYYPTLNEASLWDDKNKWNTVPPSKVSLKPPQTTTSLLLATSQPYYPTNNIPLQQSPKAKGAKTTSTTIIPLQQPPIPKGTKTTSTTIIPLQQPPKPKGTKTTSTTIIPLQQPPKPKGAKTTSAALNKLLQPKKETAVHTMDAHHGAAMLNFFGTTPASSAPHNSNAASHGAGASQSFDPSLGLQQMQSSLFFPKDVKGRQRVRPRTKKFTALKKKVLEERLRKWNEAQAATSATTESTTTNTSSCPAPTTVCLWGFCSEGELDDAEEYEEILDNLRDMATKLEVSGCVTPNIFLPRTKSPLIHGLDASSLLSNGSWPAWVQFTHSTSVEAAVASWNGLVVAGQTIRCHAVTLPQTTTADPPLALETEKVDTESMSQAETTTELDAVLQWQSQCWALLIANSNTVGVDVDGDEPVVNPDNVASTAFSILIENAITQDDLDDEDCLIESLQDLRALCSNYGNIETLDLESDNDQLLVLPRLQVTFTSGDPLLVLAKLNAISVRGQQFVATILSMKRDFVQVHLRNILTAEDFEDDDCLRESLNDVRELAQQFGQAASVVVEKVHEESIVRVDYPTLDEAECAVTGFNDTIIGGKTVSASLAANGPADTSKTLTASVFCVCLQNVLTSDDLEDHECLEESLNDVRELAQKFGPVTSVAVEKSNDGESIEVVAIYYTNLVEAQSAAAGLNGSVIGGNTVSASLVTVGLDSTPSSTTDTTGPSSINLPKEPGTMFSGDKIISERFAECKRAPKIVNSQAAPRPYATSLNETDAATVKTLIVEMLGELMRLQKRAVEDKNAKARRRLVMGLREVARGVRAHKVKMVVMASNLDEYGIIDQTLQDIIELCKSEEVPIFYEFTKRALGKALGKTIKIAVVGIQNADGAHQQFKAVMKYAIQI